MGKRRTPAKPPRNAKGRFLSKDSAQWVRVEAGERAKDKAYKPPRSTSFKAVSKTKTWAYAASKARPSVEPLQKGRASEAAKRRGYEVKQVIAARKVERVPKSRAKVKPGKPGRVTRYKDSSLAITRSVWRFGWPHGIDLARALTYVYEGRGNVRMNVSIRGRGPDGEQSIGSATESPFIVRDWLDNYEKLPSFVNLMEDIDESTLSVEVEVLQLKRR